MTPVTLIHRLGRLLSGVVLVAAGAYMFIYLVRWEWNRALVAGVFFLAAEVFLVADVLLGRVGALGRRVDRAREEEQAQLLADRLRANRPDRTGPFAWLHHDPNRVSVLLPILIGAGVVLSALSYLVEQIARVSALPVAEDDLARGLAAIALPAEGLAPIGRLPSPASRPPMPDRSQSVSTVITLAGAVALVTALVTGGIMVLKSVPEPADPGRVMHVDLVVRQRNLSQPEPAIAMGLWATCRTRVPREVSLVSLESVDADDPSRLRMTLSPAPAQSDQREFLGCLQDAVIERTWTSVVGVQGLTAGSRPVQEEARPGTTSSSAGTVNRKPTSSVPV